MFRKLFDSPFMQIYFRQAPDLRSAFLFSHRLFKNTSCISDYPGTCREGVIVNFRVCHSAPFFQKSISIPRFFSNGNKESLRTAEKP